MAGALPAPAHGSKTPCQVGLNWLVAKGAVPIASMRNERQARDLAGVLDWALPADGVDALEAASERV